MARVAGDSDGVTKAETTAGCLKPGDAGLRFAACFMIRLTTKRAGLGDCKVTARLGTVCVALRYANVFFTRRLRNARQSYVASSAPGPCSLAWAAWAARRVRW
eukprot:8549997-Alexandrium_andersonii.AAC.1